jgi:hypothetical protein
MARRGGRGLPAGAAPPRVPRRGPAQPEKSYRASRHDPPELLVVPAPGQGGSFPDFVGRADNFLVRFVLFCGCGLPTKMPDACEEASSGPRRTIGRRPPHRLRASQERQTAHLTLMLARNLYIPPGFRRWWMFGHSMVCPNIHHYTSAEPAARFGWIAKQAPADSEASVRWWIDRSIWVLPKIHHHLSGHECDATEASCLSVLAAALCSRIVPCRRNDAAYER